MDEKDLETVSSPSEHDQTRASLCHSVNHGQSLEMG